MAPGASPIPLLLSWQGVAGKPGIITSSLQNSKPQKSISRIMMSVLSILHKLVSDERLVDMDYLLHQHACLRILHHCPHVHHQGLVYAGTESFLIYRCFKWRLMQLDTTSVACHPGFWPSAASVSLPTYFSLFFTTAYVMVAQVSNLLVIGVGFTSSPFVIPGAFLMRFAY